MKFWLIHHKYLSLVFFYVVAILLAAFCDSLDRARKGELSWSFRLVDRWRADYWQRLMHRETVRALHNRLHLSLMGSQTNRKHDPEWSLKILRYAIQIYGAYFYDFGILLCTCDHCKKNLFPYILYNEQLTLEVYGFDCEELRWALTSVDDLQKAERFDQ